MSLGPLLTQLENSQLVRRLDDAELVYVFKHTLTQESVYASMLRTRRMELHRAVAEAMENLCRAELEQNAAVLALHFERAGMTAKAFHYAVLAGDAAARSYANHEALSLYDRALALAEQLDFSSIRGSVRAIYVQRGRVLEVMGDHPAAVEHFRAMIAFAQRRGDVAMEADGLNHLLTTYGIMGQSEQFESEQERALELARQSGDEALVGAALWNMGLVRRFGDPQRAVEYFRRTLHHARAAGLKELEAYALGDLASAEQLIGRFGIAHTYSLQALAAFRALGNKPMIANSLGTLSESLFARGESDQARAMAEEGAEIGQAIGNPWGHSYNLWARMQVLIAAGEFDEALARVDHILAIARELGVGLFTGLTKYLLGQTYAELGQYERALRILKQSSQALAPFGTTLWPFTTAGGEARVHLAENRIDLAQAVVESVWDPSSELPHAAALAYIAPSVAELAWRERRLEDGLRFCDQALQRLESEEMWGYAAELYYWRSIIQGDLSSSPAERDLQRAREIAGRANHRVLQWRIEAVAARQYAASGQVGPARAAHERAVAVIRDLVGHISDTALLDSFLGRRDVAAALSEP